MWTELIEETQRGLTALHTDDLEALAQRAEDALEETSRQGIRDAELSGLAARHRVLGDLLESTHRNLEVLRRLRGGAQDGRGGLRWVR